MSQQRMQERYDEAQDDFRRGDYRAACHKCGELLEGLLSRLHEELERELPPEQRLTLRGMGATETSAGAPLTLSPLIEKTRQLIQAGLHERLASRYGDAFESLNIPTLTRIARLRNSSAHWNAYTSTHEDAEFCLAQTLVYLRRFRRLPAADRPRLYTRPEKKPDLNAAVEAIREIVCSLGEDSPALRIQVLGLTLFRAWPDLTNAILPAFRKLHPRTPIDLQLTMLDRAWIEDNRIHPEWSHQAETSEHLIRTFGEGRVQELQPMRLTLHTYRNFPGMHGFLIDGSFIVASLLRLAERTEGTVTADGSRGAYFISRCETSDLAEYMADHFSHSFATATSAHPVLTYSQGWS